MTDFAGLQADVADRYARLGLPSWPDPHPDGAPARDDEYERSTDPERYRIVHARARLWREALDMPQGRLPLLLTDVDGPVPALRIAAGEPPVVLDTLPDCGCDACDRGSEDLLDAMDRMVGMVVGGPFVVLTGPGWHAWWSPDGGATSNAAEDHRSLMEICERLAGGQDVPVPAGTTAQIGRSWFS